MSIELSIYPATAINIRRDVYLRARTLSCCVCLFAWKLGEKILWISTWFGHPSSFSVIKTHAIFFHHQGIFCFGFESFIRYQNNRCQKYDVFSCHTLWGIKANSSGRLLFFVSVLPTTMYQLMSWKKFSLVFIPDSKPILADDVSYMPFSILFGWVV